VSVLGGLLASFLFSRLWKTLAGDDQVPKATDRDRTWPAVLTTACLQGAFYGLVKAAIDRAGASGVEKVTGDWPTGT